MLGFNHIKKIQIIFFVFIVGLVVLYRYGIYDKSFENGPPASLDKCVNEESMLIINKKITSYDMAKITLQKCHYYASEFLKSISVNEDEYDMNSYSLIRYYEIEIEKNRQP